jgi:hypothetical protein
MKSGHMRIIGNVDAGSPFTAHVSFRRDRGDAHTQEAYPFVETEETRVDSKCLVSLS